MPRPVDHIIIGNPENRRLQFFLEALCRHGLSSAKVISYASILAEPARIDELSGSEALIRLESPGENFAVERALIALGAGHASSSFSTLSAAQALKLTFDKGLIRYMHQWYRGYRTLLQRLSAAAGSQARFYNNPHDVTVMFHKGHCHQLLKQHGVPKVPLLGELHSFAQLHELMEQHDCRRVFIKPKCGSSASGVLALAKSRRGYAAYSSITMQKSAAGLELRNCLRIQTYRNSADIAALIDRLALEDCIVERWMPKAHFNRRSFDVRVLVIGGTAAHVVVRTSRSPMTNLHLGNARGAVDDIIALMGAENWAGLLHAAEQAAQCFPAACYVGVDIMVTRRYSRPYVLEVNAFGDLLPNVRWRGMNSYEAEVGYMLNHAKKSDALPYTYI